MPALPGVTFGAGKDACAPRGLFSVQAGMPALPGGVFGAGRDGCDSRGVFSEQAGMPALPGVFPEQASLLTFLPRSDIM